MTTITLQLEDAKAQALREKAKRYGLGAEQFLQASVDDLVGRPDPDFDQAARRILLKNQDLYRRLGGRQSRRQPNKRSSSGAPSGRIML